MGSLKDRLERIKASFAKQAPAEAKAVMERATRQLRESGILSRLPTIGSPLPAFVLEDTEGNSVSSDKLIQNGPFIVTFYRGLW